MTELRVLLRHTDTLYKIYLCSPLKKPYQSHQQESGKLSIMGSHKQHDKNTMMGGYNQYAQRPNPRPAQSSNPYLQQRNTPTTK